MATLLGLAFLAPAVPAHSASATSSSPPSRSATQELFREDERFLVAAHRGKLAEIAAGRLALALVGRHECS